MRPTKQSIPIAAKEGKLPITKLDAAIRQLETAIVLWFSDGDPVSICTLSFASYEILFALTKKSRKQSTLLDMEWVKPEYRQVAHDIIKADPNFCKHGGKDPFETHFLVVKNLPLTMMQAAALYNELGFGRRAVIEVFIQWMWLSEPALFKSKPMDASGKEIDPAAAVKIGKGRFFDVSLPIWFQRLSGSKSTRNTT